ncbi:MAG: FkbM family methyltransferase [Proteobacteria bacterium]|jgi:FkbM family methyltransferase|nr:FkbM family methyltransferase [Pseudomonadota bacterium]
MIIKTASGKEYNLDFEPILTLMSNPANYTEFIINQINSGYYNMQKCGVVVDAGANVGLFSIYASTIADVVYAIEPTPEHFCNLCAIINHLEITNVIPIQLALWQTSGDVKFNLYNGGNTTMNSVAPNGEITVAALTVEDFFNRIQIDKADYFKCDIEGGEHFIDFAPVAKKIEQLFIEVHDTTGIGLSETANNFEPKLKNLWKNVVRLSEDAIVAFHDK